MIATREQCGTNEGLRWHYRKDEDLCDLCRDWAATRSVAIERHIVATSADPVMADLRTVIHLLATLMAEPARTRKATRA